MQWPPPPAPLDDLDRERSSRLLSGSNSPEHGVVLSVGIWASSRMAIIVRVFALLSLFQNRLTAFGAKLIAPKKGRVCMAQCCAPAHRP